MRGGSDDAGGPLQAVCVRCGVLVTCVCASSLPRRTYLVRDSTTVPNSFVLTMFAKGVSKNFQILPVSCHGDGALCEPF